MDEKAIAVLWKQVLDDLKKETSNAQFVTVFKPTTLISLDGNVATVAAPSQMVINLLQKRYGQALKKSLSTCSGKDIEVLFVPKVIHTSASAKQSPEEAGPLFGASLAPSPVTVGHLPRVRPEFTFSNFAVSSSNQLAFVSATTVAKHIG